ncbi:MAG TPA: hypothetical protein VK929_13515 [Longimicrobiales bacterium]|nr:hypothetical protein [Longimicrobiales bacterium]
MSPFTVAHTRSTLSWMAACLCMCSAACGSPAPQPEPGAPVSEPGIDTLVEATVPDTAASDTVAAQPPPQPGTPEFSEVPWNAARDRGAAWRGLGQEPGWTVEIHADSIVYVGDYGEHNVTMPAPEPVRDGSRITWHATTASADLRVVFEELPCTDIMSGQEFHWTVTLTIDGRELRGCGRRL